MKKSSKMFAFVAIAVLAGVALAAEYITVAVDETATAFNSKVDVLIQQADEVEKSWDERDAKKSQLVVDQIRLALSAKEEVTDLSMDMEAKGYRNEGKALQFKYQGRFVHVYLPFKDWNNGRDGLKWMMVYATGKEVSGEEAKAASKGPQIYLREYSYGARQWLSTQLKYKHRSVEVVSDPNTMVEQILGFSERCAIEKG